MTLLPQDFRLANEAIPFLGVSSPSPSLSVLLTSAGGGPQQQQARCCLCVRVCKTNSLFRMDVHVFPSKGVPEERLVSGIRSGPSHKSRSATRTPLDRLQIWPFCKSIIVKKTLNLRDYSVTVEKHLNTSSQVNQFLSRAVFLGSC